MPTKREDGIFIHSEDEFEKMRKAGKLAAETLDYITDFIKPGVSTLELDNLMHDFITKNGAIPAPLNYKGYPKSTCISINHVICHGIPSEDKILKNGDILNIDVTVILDGWYGDTSRMFFAGKPKIKAKRLVDVTYECLMLAINEVKPGNTLGDLGYVIAQHAKKFGYSVVDVFCGHGIGNVFHCPPNVIHTGRKGEGTVLQEGMIFTIEPMINIGKKDAHILSDGWTAVTRDKTLSAQFEHTMAVTADGVEIFTESPKNIYYPSYGKK